MAELTYFSVISRVDGSSGKRRITIHPKIEGGRRSTDVHQVNEGGPPDTGDGANLFSSRGRACDYKEPTVRALAALCPGHARGALGSLRQC
jgi:hypothetical protein